MTFSRSLSALVLCCSLIALASCQTAPPPPVMAPPASFIPLGIKAPYLTGDVIGGKRARSAKMKAAGIKPLSGAGAASYSSTLETELRRQTAGIGLDVIRLSNGILIRIPAAFTFTSGSAAVNPQFDATLLEIARTVKSQNQSFVDVLAHTDTTGTPQVNQTLSDKRAAAVATFLSKHGVAKGRIASKGYGESAPLYADELTEEQKAGNRRVEIRLVPYVATDSRR